MVADALLRMLVDDGQDAEGPAHGRDVGYEVPRPHVARMRGLGRHPARGEALIRTFSFRTGTRPTLATTIGPRLPNCRLTVWISGRMG